MARGSPQSQLRHPRPIKDTLEFVGNALIPVFNDMWKAGSWRSGSSEQLFQTHLAVVLPSFLVSDRP